jgi:hypothetical protein
MPQIIINNRDGETIGTYTGHVALLQACHALERDHGLVVDQDLFETIREDVADYGSYHLGDFEIVELFSCFLCEGGDGSWTCPLCLDDEVDARAAERAALLAPKPVHLRRFNDDGSVDHAILMEG